MRGCWFRGAACRNQKNAHLIGEASARASLLSARRAAATPRRSAPPPKRPLALANGATSPRGRYPPTGGAACFERPCTSAIDARLVSFVVRRRGLVVVSRQWCTPHCDDAHDNRRLVAIKTAFARCRNPAELLGSLHPASKSLIFTLLSFCGCRMPKWPNANRPARRQEVPQN